MASTIVSPGTSDSGGLDKFLQPQSMVTPGVLGGVAMVGTNVIGLAYHIAPDTWILPTISLVLSFLFGLAALVRSTSVLEKLAYYFFNSIVIFTVANGSNTIGQHVQPQQAAFFISSSAFAAPTFSHVSSHLSLEGVQFFRQWFPNQPNVPTPKSGTICLFTSGPRAGQRRDGASSQPLAIGSPCSDGQGTSGTIVGK